MNESLNFSGALSSWKDIKFQELQSNLEQQGVQLITAQKEGLLGRKRLAESTREFKKLEESERLNAVKGLLKSYQIEVDALTTRSKNAEGHFLDLYKVLSDVPDPYPLLEVAVDMNIKASETKIIEDKLTKVTAENAALQQELDAQKSASMDSKKTQDKLTKLEARMEEQIALRIKEKENELNATYDERIRNFEDREKDLVSQLSLNREQLKALRSTADSSQAKLLSQPSLDGRSDREEITLLLRDLDRANTRVAQVEQRNEMLRADIESAKAESGMNEKTRRLEENVDNLEVKLQAGSEALTKSKKIVSDLQDTVRHLENAKQLNDQEKTKEIASLQEKLKGMSDYDTIKRELDIMKYVEFSYGERDEGDSNAASFGSDGQMSTERLLIDKNSRLTDELAELRNKVQALDGNSTKHNAELQAAREELATQQGLVNKLEMDLQLLSVKSGSSDSNEASNIVSPSSSSQDASILPVITSQRDRFRQRNAELEEELQKQFKSILDLRAESKSLQSDNLKLYEKLRYMQTYREENRGSGNSVNISSAELGKYDNMYEESMNPFEAFRGREAVRAVQALNPFEKVVLVLTKAVLGNRKARLGFIVYTIGLHIFIAYVMLESIFGSDIHSAGLSPIKIKPPI